MIADHGHLIVADQLHRLVNASKDAPIHHQGTLLLNILTKMTTIGQVRGNAPVLPYAALLISPGPPHQCHHILHARFIQTECQLVLELALLSTIPHAKPHMKVRQPLEKGHHLVEPVPHPQQDPRRVTIVNVHLRPLVDGNRHLL